MANLWTPVLAEKRATFLDVGTDFARALIGSSQNTSGQVVTSRTALGVTAYFDCIRNISDDVAKTPMFMTEDTKPGMTKAIHRHAMLTLVSDQPNPFMDGMVFWSTMIGHMLGWKGGFAEIVLNGAGQPVEMWPIDPNTMSVIWDIQRKTLIYEVNSEGKFFRFRPDEIFHLRGFGFDGFTSWLMSDIAQLTIGRALATREFSAAFFGNGATLKAVLEAPPTLTEKGMELLKTTFRDRHQGASKAHGTPILPDGVTYREITNDPKKSQLIEAMHLGTEEIAGLFRMPLHKIQHDLRSTFSNVTELNKLYQQDTLSGPARRVVQECKSKLLIAPRDKNKRFRYDWSDLLRADPVANADVLLKKFQMGGLTINEQLQEDNKPGIGPKGNVRFVMANLVPLEKALEPKPGPPEPGPEPDEPESPDTAETGTENTIKAVTALFKRDFRRFQRITETKAMTAQEKDHINEWAEKHYVAEEKYITEYFMEHYAILVSVVPSNDRAVSDLAESMAKEYVRESYTRVMAGSRGEKIDTLERFAGIMAVRAVQMARG